MSVPAWAWLAFDPAIYLFGAVLLLSAVRLLRGGHDRQPQRSRALRAMGRVLPATEELRGQRFVVRDGGRLLVTPLLLALIVVETTDVIFAVDSIPAVLAVTGREWPSSSARWRPSYCLPTSTRSRTGPRPPSSPPSWPRSSCCPFATPAARVLHRTGTWTAARLHRSRI